MVLAAPLFLINSTKGARAFYLANKQGFVNLGLGVLTAYMALRQLSKTYEIEKLEDELVMAKGEHAAVLARLTDAGWVARELAPLASKAAGEPATVAAAIRAAAEDAVREHRRAARAAAGDDGSKPMSLAAAAEKFRASANEAIGRPAPAAAAAARRAATAPAPVEGAGAVAAVAAAPVAEAVAPAPVVAAPPSRQLSRPGLL